jgi:RimJ/RimL family protein N-acetyltransferase
MKSYVVEWCGYKWRPITLSDEDTEFICELRNRPECRAGFFDGSAVTPEGHRDFVRGLIERNEHYWIVEKEGRRLGAYSIYHIDLYNQKAEAGRIAILGDSRAAYLTGKVCPEIAFMHFGLHKLYGEVLVSNIASKRYFVRIGWTLEGLLRKHAYKYNQWIDVYVYSILAEEWMSEREKTLKRWGPMRCKEVHL